MIERALGQPTNIKELILPNERSAAEFNPPFVPERDMPQNLLGYMEREVADPRIHAARYFNLVSTFKLLYPEKFEQIEIDEENWQDMFRQTLRYKSDYNQLDYYRNLTYIKTVSPERFREIEKITPYPESAWETAKRIDFKRFWDNDFYGYLALTASMKLTFPNKFEKHKLGVPISEIVEKMKSEDQFPRHTLPYLDLTAAIKNIRILYPEEFNTLSVCKQDWKRNLKELKNLGGLYESFSDYTKNLLILAAGSISVTNDGLEMDMMHTRNKQEADQIPPIPATRRFAK